MEKLEERELQSLKLKNEQIILNCENYFSKIVE